MHHSFETPQPVDLYVENGRGRVSVTATDTDSTSITITGEQADEFTVEQDGDRVAVIGPRNAGFGRRTADAFVDVVLPATSGLTAKLGSSDLTSSGPLGATWVNTGSGDVVLDTVEGAASLQAGSGDLRVERLGQESRIKSGSGDVHVVCAAGGLVVSTGSGDITVDDAKDSVAVKSGSGDVRIGETHDLACTTASGDLLVEAANRGRLGAKTASGDIGIGFTAGTPVWTDLNTVSGRITSQLPRVGEPAEGQAYVELRATTVSGDITLHQS